MRKEISLFIQGLLFFSALVFGIGLGGGVREGAAQESIRTCGLKGTVQERVADCAKPFEEGGFGIEATRLFDLRDHLEDPLDDDDDHSVNVWSLVTRAENRRQFWLSRQSGLIWSDESCDEMPYGEAHTFCEEMTTLFSGVETFGVPTLVEYKLAHWEGLFSILPEYRLADYVWTSTLQDAEKNLYYAAWEEFRYSGISTKSFFSTDLASVRCVADSAE